MLDSKLEHLNILHCRLVPGGDVWRAVAEVFQDGISNLG